MFCFPGMCCVQILNFFSTQFFLSIRRRNLVVLDLDLHLLMTSQVILLSDRIVILGPFHGSRLCRMPCSSPSIRRIGYSEFMHSLLFSMAVLNVSGHVLPVSYPNIEALQPHSVTFAEAVASLFAPRHPGCQK